MRISIKSGAVFSTSYIFLAIVAVSHAFVFWIPVWKSTSPSTLEHHHHHHKQRHFSPRHHVRSAWKWRPLRSSLHNLNHHHPLCPLCHVAHYWNKPRKHHSNGGGGGGGGEGHRDFFHHSPHHHHHHHHHPKQHVFSPSNIFPRLRHHLSHLPKKLKNSFIRSEHHHQHHPDDGFLGPHHSFAKFNDFPKFGHFPKGMHDLPKFTQTKTLGGGRLSPHHHNHHHHHPNPHKHYNYHSATKSHNLDNYYRNNPPPRKTKTNNNNHPQHYPKIPNNYYPDSHKREHYPPAQDSKYYDDEDEDRHHYPEDSYPQNVSPSVADFPEEQMINPAELINSEINHSPSNLGVTSMESKDSQQQEGPPAAEESPKEFSNVPEGFTSGFGAGKKGHGWGGWDW